jgi:hypothetical protein
VSVDKLADESVVKLEEESVDKLDDKSIDELEDKLVGTEIEDELEDDEPQTAAVLV